MSEVDVLITRLDPGLPLPAYSHPGDAGMDLYAAHEVDIPPAGRVLVSTGIAIALPPGYAGFVHPRSGHALRLGISMPNSPGVIDAGYRGEVRVILVNLDPQHSVAFGRGDRIAQLVVQRVSQVVLHEVQRLPGSDRGDGGFGSTGGRSEEQP